MSKRRHDDLDDDFDDGFEDDAFLDGEPAQPRFQKRRDPRGPAKPRGPRESGSGRRPDKPSRRDELASLNAWGAPY
ncbi:MAG TPA: hypothetical protein VLD39_05120 [Gammaproteobacteria bacterium]|nr:hypothetical protein [Gammaproteobacteria bacterium]